MRRALVLTEESARHPFRASLPAHVFRIDGDAGRPSAAELTMADLRRLLQVYCAAFVVVATFIA